MVDYLTHYYMRGSPPFRSLSSLPDYEAKRIMQSLYEDKVVWERFKDPERYLRSRRATEAWVRGEFLRKGGRPRAAHPVYLVLGTSPWIVKNAPDPRLHAEIRVPLSGLEEEDVSFTYPDSMISLWFGTEKPPEHYQAAYHGRVFTKGEILELVSRRGLPEEGWTPALPDAFAPYIEAQVWNHEALEQYCAMAGAR